MEEKKSFLDKIKGIMKGTRTKKDSVDAMDAFFQTKYGDIKSPEHYVEVAQQYITRMIKTRMNPERYNPDEPLCPSAHDNVRTIKQSDWATI